MHYRLVPDVAVAQLGSRHYVFDRSLATSAIVRVPTRAIPSAAYDIIQTIQQRHPANRPQPLDALKQLFTDPADQRSVDVLVRRGYIEAVDEERAVVNAPRETDHSTAAQRFDATERNHYLRPSSFFNLPSEIDDSEAHVAVVGVPFASGASSVLTTSAPAVLRALSQSLTWFAVHADGVYSETAFDEGMPVILGRGVVPKDFGDIGARAETVNDLFEEVRTLVETRLAPNGIAPLFIGGDHALSFPVVDAYIRRQPELCVIHLDAHNDLFYSDTIRYNHASPMSNLLRYSNLSALYSFGLRTPVDMRTQNVRRVANDARLRSRLHLHSIAALKRLLAEPSRMRDLLDQIGPKRPCYLSLDIDVLTAGSIAYQTSKPAGAGLEWWELFELIGLLFERLSIVACDLVEFSPPSGTTRLPGDNNMQTLLLLLVHYLAHATGRVQ